MIKLVIRLIGYFFLIIGVIGILTPIPFGLFFLLLAMFCLIPTSPGFAKKVQSLRKRFPSLNNSLTNITAKLPYPYRRILRETEISDLYS